MSAPAKKMKKTITTMFQSSTPKSQASSTPKGQSSKLNEPLLPPISPTQESVQTPMSPGPDSPGHLARRILRGRLTDSSKLPKPASVGFETEEDSHRLYTQEKTISLRFWKILVATSILSSSLSFGIDQATMAISLWREQFTNFYNGTDLVGIIIFNCALCVIARLLIRTTVEAEGSGFPEMKAMLFGHILDNYLTFRVLACKAIALTLEVGAGLPMGKEGPNCHMAGCIARELDMDFHRKRESSLKGASQIRQLLLAACAVGVGTSFSAPIGGVIFALELMLPQIYDSSCYWGCFVAAVTGSLFYEALRTWTAGGNMLLPLISSNVMPGEGATTLYPLLRMLLDIGLGVVCGFLGGMWVRMHSQLAGIMKRWRLRGMPTPRTEEYLANRTFLQKARDTCFPFWNWQWRDLYTLCGAVIVTTLWAAAMPLLNGKPQPVLLSDLFDKNLFHSRAEEWVVPELGMTGTMICCMLMKYFTTMLCLTMAVPAGIVAPVMIIGGTIGRVYILLVPQWIQDILLTMPDGSPITDDARGAFMARFGIVGAAAFSTGVSRAFSMAITIFEVLALPNAVLPLCCATLTSIFVANKIALPYFDANLAARGLGGIPALTFTDHAIQPAFSVMRKLNVKTECVNVHSRLYDLHNLLRKSKDEFFAVVKPLEERPDEALLVGQIKRSAMDQLISKLDPKAKNPEMQVDLTDQVFQLPDEADAEPMVQASPPTCTPDTQVKDVYLQMKVAHSEGVVYVTNNNCLLGVISFASLMSS